MGSDISLQIHTWLSSQLRTGVVSLENSGAWLLKLKEDLRFLFLSFHRFGYEADCLVLTRFLFLLRQLHKPSLYLISAPGRFGRSCRFRRNILQVADKIINNAFKGSELLDFEERILLLEKHLEEKKD